MTRPVPFLVVLALVLVVGFLAGRQLGASVVGARPVCVNPAPRVCP